MLVLGMVPRRGWVNRDHLLLECAKPNRRAMPVKPISKNYGKTMTPGEVASSGGKITKEKREKLLHVRD